jgi:hypothetical protein
LQEEGLEGEGLTESATGNGGGTAPLLVGKIGQRKLSSRKSYAVGLETDIPAVTIAGSLKSPAPGG